MGHIKFNPLKSQLIIFGGCNVFNNNQWQLYPMGTQGKITGCIFFAVTDLSEACRNFYGEFNSITSVLGKCSNEMVALHLPKTYCLPTLPVVKCGH